MENPDRESLFRRLLGDDYDSLSNPVRKLHDAAGGTVFHGTASVRRGNALASLLGYFVSLPSARDEAPLSVLIEKTDANEVWHRDFVGDTMVSTLRERNGMLSERLGPVRFSFALRARNGEIVWTVSKVSALGVPLPVRWFNGISSREYADNGRYRFVVRASLPLIGQLIEYHGELEISSDA